MTTDPLKGLPLLGKLHLYSSSGVSGEEHDSAFPSGEWGNVIAAGASLGNLISWARTNWP